MTDLLLSARGLAFERDGEALFEGINLELTAGSVVELLGPNGSGKTTLLRCLAGLIRDYRGEVVRAAAVVYVGHRLGLSAALSPAENLAWYGSFAGRGATTEDCHAALRRVGLGQRGHVPCAQLSAGQQRRAALARLLVGGARLWLLDEPLTALDDAGRELVIELLGEHRGAGGAALCATHQRLGGSSTEVMELALPPEAA